MEPGRRVVDGRFALQARLGGGGMGRVWRARDLVLDRQVAVKEVVPPDPDLAEYDPEAARQLRERVLREARALARLDHPNVVTIHHIVDGGPGTFPWIVMELVDGGSLADRLARGPMDPREAARVGRGVLAALVAAHEAGVEHRDVKPANVLMRRDGRPVLTDFGIAAVREATTLTATGSLIGTPDFMAPERVAGREGGPASDLWSLAMMLYTAVEGHHPLRRGTAVATLAAVLHEDVPPPARCGPLGDVLMSVLVRDPAARPGADVLDRRLAAVAGEGQADPSDSGRHDPTSYRLPAPTPVPDPSGATPHPPHPSGAHAGAGSFAGGQSFAGTGGGSAGAPGQAPSAGPAGASGTPGAAPSGHPAAGAGLGALPGSPAGALSPHGTPQGVPGGPGHGAGYGPGFGPAPAMPATVPQQPSGGGGRRRAPLAALSAVAVVGVAGLAWWLLPLDGSDSRLGAEDPARSASPASPGGSAQPTSAPRSPAAGSSADPAADGSDASDPDVVPEGANMLEPANIRKAIKALEKETGRDTYGRFAVYPDYVTASVMVEGSRTKFDSYVYRAGRGVEKGLIDGTLTSFEQPFTLDRFAWDRVPALLREAERRLNVDEPSLRYVRVRYPDTFTPGFGFAVYLTDDYGSSGYLTTDTAGKILKTYPAKD